MIFAWWCQQMAKNPFIPAGLPYFLGIRHLHVHCCPCHKISSDPWPSRQVSAKEVLAVKEQQWAKWTETWWKDQKALEVGVYSHLIYLTGVAFLRWIINVG